MNLFSQRQGLKPIKKIMQIDDMDEDLRNSLWNALTLIYWQEVTSNSISYHNRIETLITKLWVNYFKKPIDNLSSYWFDTKQEIRDYFFSCEWYEVYDFIEFVANNYPEERVNSRFVNVCNSVLERELSAYRFIEGKITPITEKVEIEEIEEALQKTEPLKGVKDHLKRALDLFADRKSPDYRNSIKESILAVEGICKLIAKEEKATLGEALSKIQKSINLHPSFKNSLKSLYGYTNDAEGIRHALLKKPNLSSEDAKFMLVSCSAFINYLITKAIKSGIKI